MRSVIIVVALCFTARAQDPLKDAPKPSPEEIVKAERKADREYKKQRIRYARTIKSRQRSVNRRARQAVGFAILMQRFANQAAIRTNHARRVNFALSDLYYLPYSVYITHDHDHPMEVKPHQHYARENKNVHELQPVGGHHHHHHP